MASKTTVKVGDKVQTTRGLRHGIIVKGMLGVVTEIRNTGCKYTDGIVVEFMAKPSPYIAKLFGKDPNKAEPYLALFPASLKILPFKVMA